MKAQLALPLKAEAQSHSESALRAAWIRSGLRLPFHIALQIRSVAICLRCLADSMQRNAYE